MPLLDDSEHFQSFAKSLERAISKYGSIPEEELTKIQCQQVEELASLERDFMTALNSDPNGDKAYEEFIKHITEENKNSLTARPFFRERRSVFTSDIFDAIRNKDIQKLKDYHVNFNFASLVCGRLQFGPAVTQLMNEIKAARQKLITMNMPLVINRASIFWSRTPKSNLTFMDLIQIGTEGLIAAIDKYCGKYTEVYRGVIIGRIVGLYIRSYSSTMIHFYPQDKRKLYRANKFRSKHPDGSYSFDELVDRVGGETSESEIVNLLAAASMVLPKTTVWSDGDTDDTDIIDRCPDGSGRPDDLAEEGEALAFMRMSIEKLPLIDKKLLLLKGIDIPGFLD